MNDNLLGMLFCCCWCCCILFNHKITFPECCRKVCFLCWPICWIISSMKIVLVCLLIQWCIINTIVCDYLLSNVVYDRNEQFTVFYVCKSFSFLPLLWNLSSFQPELCFYSKIYCLFIQYALYIFNSVKLAILHCILESKCYSVALYFTVLHMHNYDRHYIN